MDTRFYWEKLKAWNNKDVKGALFWMTVIILGGFLVSTCTACTGSTLSLQYDHHSSIPDYRDLETVDVLGPCLEVPYNGGASRYAPSIETCVQWSVHGKSPFGHEPSGSIRLKQPIRVF